VDVVRVLTVALVIAVHVVAQQPGGIGLSNGAALTVMHVSREVFFLLTAFVLGYSYRDRAPSRWSVFWRRRYLLVGVPYLVWSAVYFLADGHDLLPAGPALRAFASDVEAGTARYHLYFLLVTMQMYLVFPLLRGLLHRTRRWHGWLLAAAAVYQVGFYTAVQHHLTAGPLTGWLRDPSAFLPSYLGFVIAGGVAAQHTDAFFAWTRARARWIYAGCAVTVAVGVGVFLIQALRLRQAPVAASDVFQPVVVAESVAIAWTFLALGLAWQRRRRPARRLVRAASDASFGVYLAHPLLLQGLLTLSAAAGLSALARRAPGLLVTAVSMVIVVPLLYLTCAVLAEAARRTPVSLPLTGRTRRRAPQPGPNAPHESDGQTVPAPITVPAISGGMQCQRQPA
jgi:uncharacterized protein (TIGR03382 family)